MIRFGSGYSDLNENMDHRFIVPGATEKWSKGYLIEENLKENNISFWIEKHNRYSDLIAQEEIERRLNLRTQTIQPNLWGSPDQYRAYLKKIWWRLPLYVRPFLYFFYRMVFQLGFLDGHEGRVFHFLQSFWFRLVVDIKIDEIITAKKRSYRRFVIKFLLRFSLLSFLFYYFNILFYGLTTPGGHYIPLLANYLNYIQVLRWVLLTASSLLLKLLGFSVITNNYGLLVAGRGSILVVYSCLGLGVSSIFSAFVLVYPKPLKAKISFIFAGILSIEILNILRFVLLALFWNKTDNRIIDHHAVFNIIIYILIAISLNFWVKTPASK